MALPTVDRIRYGEIEDTFGGVSSSTLSARLSELIDAGLLYNSLPSVD
ncbi:hypothetical protein [Natrarchaeobius chitinivorans]|nr:hypothetical protein [Natrarchaeobius chitinivorans]